MLRLRVQCFARAAKPTAAPKPKPPASEDKKVENTAKAAGVAAKALSVASKGFSFFRNLGNRTSMHGVDTCKICTLNARACPAVAICSPAPKQIAVAAKCEHTCKSGKKPVTNPFFKPSFNGCAALPLARWRASGSRGELASAVRPSGLGENPDNLERYKRCTARSIQRDGWHATCSACRCSCGPSALGITLDIGGGWYDMTECCNGHDLCYDTCNSGDPATAPWVPHAGSDCGYGRRRHLLRRMQARRAATWHSSSAWGGSVPGVGTCPAAWPLLPRCDLRWTTSPAAHTSNRREAAALVDGQQWHDVVPVAILGCTVGHVGTIFFGKHFYRSGPSGQQ